METRHISPRELKNKVTQYIINYDKNESEWNKFIEEFKNSKTTLDEKIKCIEYAFKHADSDPKRDRAMILIEQLLDIYHDKNELFNTILPLYLSTARYSSPFIIKLLSNYCGPEDDRKSIQKIFNFKSNSTQLNLHILIGSGEKQAIYDASFKNIIQLMKDNKLSYNPKVFINLLKSHFIDRPDYPYFYRPTYRLDLYSPAHTERHEDFLDLLQLLLENNGNASQIHELLDRLTRDNLLSTNQFNKSIFFKFSQLLLLLHEKGIDSGKIRSLYQQVECKTDSFINAHFSLTDYHRIFFQTHFAKILYPLALHNLLPTQEYHEDAAKLMLDYICELSPEEKLANLQTIKANPHSSLGSFFWKKKNFIFFQGGLELDPKMEKLLNQKITEATAQLGPTQQDIIHSHMTHPQEDQPFLNADTSNELKPIYRERHPTVNFDDLVFPEIPSTLFQKTQDDHKNEDKQRAPLLLQ